MAIDGISSLDLFYVLLSRFLSNCILNKMTNLTTLLTNKILLNEPLTKWLLLKKRHSAYHGLLKPNLDLQTRRNFRAKFSSELIIYNFRDKMTNFLVFTEF